VISGIRNVADAREKWKSSLKLEIQFLINRNNENQTAQVRLFAKETGAILRLKSMQVINSGDADKWLPSEQKYVRYRKEGGGYVVKGNLPDRCARLWFNPVITWDGKVVPCCFDKDAEYVMGDLTKESFRAVWTGGKYDRFRRLVLTCRKNIDICRNCTSGLIGVRC
jgi:radical SAM protein with 4Fe4S-binding SPASM domain